MIDKGLVLLYMIFLHIFDDFHLQGILADMKQKSWWEEQIKDSLYKHDYIIALFIHAFSWSFMIALPVIAYYGWITRIDIIFVIVLNCIVHAYIDDKKANKKTLNLVEDQLLHLFQIITTWYIFIYRW